MTPIPPCSNEALVELLKVLASCETDGEGVWPRVTEDGDVAILISCNDLFYWACGDAEYFTENDVALLQGAADDLRAAGEFGEVYLLELFCCRKRGMRPQFPFFRKRDPETGQYNNDTLEPNVRALFDACGPPGSDMNRG